MKECIELNKVGRKENNPFSSKEDNWIMCENMYRRKSFKRMAVITMLVIFGVSANVANASVMYHNFSFYMEPNGGIDSSSSTAKNVTGDAYASIEKIETSAAPTMYFTMRVRRASNDEKASEAYSFNKNGLGPKLMPYKSGKGATSVKYYLRMQTSSASPQCGWVSGQWRP